MSEILSGFYYCKALKCAESNDLTSAVGLASKALGINEENEKVWRLVCLCYYQLGNYRMAEYCTEQMTEQINGLKDAIAEKQQEMTKVRELVDGGQDKKAIRYLEALAHKSVRQYHYLGCIYAAHRKHKKAAECFFRALEIDCRNQNTWYYIKKLQQINRKKWW